MAVVNLTEARIRELPLNSGIWRDEQVKGLMLVCHATTKTFAVQGDVRRNGRHVRTVRVKIDRADRIGLREARNRAKAIMSQIQSGIDPTSGPEETGITVSQALDAHLCGATIKMGIPRQSGWECAAAGVTKGGRSPTGVTPAVASTPEGASFGGNGGW